MIEGTVQGGVLNHILENQTYAMCPVVGRHQMQFYDKTCRMLAKFLTPKIKFPKPRDYKYNQRMQKRFRTLYNAYIRFVPRVQEYIDEECERILQNKGTVLGVIVRGTDYSQLKPALHPIQPSIEIVLERAEKLLKDKHWDYIYLATEEEENVKKFQEKFPGRILLNNRCYYDGDYTNKYICETKNERKNDEYLRNLEYLSSMYILSKCDMLIGGMCGGSQAALLMRQNEYEYLHLFDLGNYK